MATKQTFNGLDCYMHGPAKAGTLFVFLHGDRVARTGVDWAAKFEASKTMPGAAAAIIRPDYEDAVGEVVNADNYGGPARYGRDVIGKIAGAINALKASVGASRVIGIGYSGGAACLGVLIGIAPGTVRDAVLVACPADVPRWRTMQKWSPLTGSLSPHAVINQIPGGTRIRCLTAMQDELVPIALTEDYVKALIARGIMARWRKVSGAHAHYRDGAVDLLGDAAIEAARELAG